MSSHFAGSHFGGSHYLSSHYGALVIQPQVDVGSPFDFDRGLLRRQAVEEAEVIQILLASVTIIDRDDEW